MKIDYIEVTLTSIGIESIPLETKLIGNYPNPFNPATTISFSLTTENTENTELVIYNLKGQKIRQYSIFNPSSAGQDYQSSIVWDGKDENNQSVSSGVYFYQLKAGNNFSKTKKMLLIK